MGGIKLAEHVVSASPHHRHRWASPTHPCHLPPSPCSPRNTIWRAVAVGGSDGRFMAAARNGSVWYSLNRWAGLLQLPDFKYICLWSIAEPPQPVQLSAAATTLRGAVGCAVVSTWLGVQGSFLTTNVNPSHPSSSRLQRQQLARDGQRAARVAVPVDEPGRSAAGGGRAGHRRGLPVPLDGRGCHVHTDHLSRWACARFAGNSWWRQLLTQRGVCPTILALLAYK